MGGKRVAGKAKLRTSTKPKKRVPSVAEPPQPNYIVWRMGRLDLDGVFSWLKLSTSDVAQLERELVHFEGKGLNELKRIRWLKLIGVEEMTIDARRRLAEI